MTTKLVIVESPFKAPTWQGILENMQYARRCLKDSLARGEAPLASHLLYPQVLDDSVPEERSQGIAAGLAWAEKAELAALYLDRGESPGMKAARAFYEERGTPIEERWLDARPLKVPEEILRRGPSTGSLREVCGDCNGSGRVAGLPCSTCGGAR